MRVPVVDHYYDAVIRWIQGREPGLDRADHTTQRARVDQALFGQTAFQVAALGSMGHEAWDSLVNVRPLQAAWAREHGVWLSPSTRWGLRRRRKWVPWPRSPDRRWMGAALIAQVRAYRPDFVLIESMDLLEPGLVTAIRDEARFVVGQVATELPVGQRYDSHGLVVSSIPDLVNRFHPEEAASIAAAGQRRTLRDHTWLDRMARFVDMVRRRT